GRAVALNPGTHVLRLEADHRVATTTSIVVREGEKVRVANVRLEPAPRIGLVRVDRPVPVSVYVTGAIGIVALGTFGAFAIAGKSQETDLRNRNCSPSCPKSETDAVKAKYLAADVSLGVGVLAFAAATYLFVTRPRIVTSAWFLAPEPLAHGSVVDAVGTF